MLGAVVDDSRKSEIKLASARTTLTRLNTEISSLTDQLSKLTAELDSKKIVFTNADTVRHELSSRLLTNELKKTGLGIRLGALLFSYLSSR
jgi:chromosome segregation ATPase